MKTEEIVENLRRHGLTDGTSLGRHAGINDIAADLLESQQNRISVLEKELATETELHHRYDAQALHNAMECDRLTDQLVASQHREKAAVEDILCKDHCDVCKFSREGIEDCEKFDFDCSECKSEICRCRNCRDEDKWEWCGPEPGEGELNR